MHEKSDLTRQWGGALVFEYPADAKPGDTARIPAFDEASITERRYPGKHKRTYKAPHHRTFVPTQAVSTPAAYLAPAELAPRLEGQGLRFERLGEPRRLTVDSYRVARREAPGCERDPGSQGSPSPAAQRLRAVSVCPWK